MATLPASVPSPEEGETWRDDPTAFHISAQASSRKAFLIGYEIEQKFAELEEDELQPLHYSEISVCEQIVSLLEGKLEEVKMSHKRFHKDCRHWLQRRPSMLPSPVIIFKKHIGTV